MTNTPAGWYPDPENAGRSRWWDGTQWTEQRSAPYTLDTTVQLKAPEGTEVNTAWIWLIVVLPLLPSLGLLFVDWSSMFDLSDPTGMSAFRIFLSPGYLFAVLGGPIIYGLCVWFAYLDWRELSRRGVPRPFHWAWAFLYTIVYVIGRSVVVRRRTGHGIAPMWAAIASIVLTFGFSIYLVVAMMSAVFASLPDLPTYTTP